MLTPTICVGPVRSHSIPITISRCSLIAGPTVTVVIAAAAQAMIVAIALIVFLPVSVCLV
jgi:hypothetical protein